MQAGLVDEARPKPPTPRRRASSARGRRDGMSVSRPSFSVARRATLVLSGESGARGAAAGLAAAIEAVRARAATAAARPTTEEAVAAARRRARRRLRSRARAARATSAVAASRRGPAAYPSGADFGRYHAGALVMPTPGAASDAVVPRGRALLARSASFAASEASSGTRAAARARGDRRGDSSAGFRTAVNAVAAARQV